MHAEPPYISPTLYQALLQGDIIAVEREITELNNQRTHTSPPAQYLGVEGNSVFEVAFRRGAIDAAHWLIDNVTPKANNQLIELTPYGGDNWRGLQSTLTGLALKRGDPKLVAHALTTTKAWVKLDKIYQCEQKEGWTGYHALAKALTGHRQKKLSTAEMNLILATLKAFWANYADRDHDFATDIILGEQTETWTKTALHTHPKTAELYPIIRELICPILNDYWDSPQQSEESIRGVEKWLQEMARSYITIRSKEVDCQVNQPKKR